MGNFFNHSKIICLSLLKTKLPSRYILLSQEENLFYLFANVKHFAVGKCSIFVWVKSQSKAGEQLLSLNNLIQWNIEDT